MFVNRKAAGVQLAQALEQYVSPYPGGEIERNVVVVGLPRGGVPVALEVARRLKCMLEVVVAKKIPYPGQPEFAIGAVSSDGVVVLNPDIPDNSQWKNYIQEQKQQLVQRTALTEEQFYFLAGRSRISFKDLTVILVDDGVATGMTAMAAVETIKLRGAARTIIAAPVISRDSYQQLCSHCDLLVALTVPEQFDTVSQHYSNFDETTNEEVVSAMRENLTFARASYQLSPS